MTDEFPTTQNMLDAMKYHRAFMCALEGALRDGMLTDVARFYVKDVNERSAKWIADAERVQGQVAAMMPDVRNFVEAHCFALEKPKDKSVKVKA